jgi:hypothetical protein
LQHDVPTSNNTIVARCTMVTSCQRCRRTAAAWHRSSTLCGQKRGWGNRCCQC